MTRLGFVPGRPMRSSFRNLLVDLRHYSQFFAWRVWPLAFALCVLVTGPGEARTPAPNSIRLGGWSGGPSFNPSSKKFDYCAATLTNNEGISVSYSVDHQFHWRLAFANA